MNYHGIYAALIDRSRSRVLIGYVERHHILPKCLGGSDEATNIAILTPEEHYLAHQLLVKMHPNHQGLLFAAVSMARGGNGVQGRKNKLYGWLKRRNQAKRRPMSDETKRKISEAKKKAGVRTKGTLGFKHSNETKEKMSESRKGWKRPNISGIRKGQTNSDEHRARISAAKKGKPWSEARKAAQLKRNEK